MDIMRMVGEGIGELVNKEEEERKIEEISLIISRLSTAPVSDRFSTLEQLFHRVNEFKIIAKVGIKPLFSVIVNENLPQDFRHKTLLLVIDLINYPEQTENTLFSSLLSLLVHPFLHLKYSTIQTLISLSLKNKEKVQELLVNHAEGSYNIVELLKEDREAIRNEALLLLRTLTDGHSLLNQSFCFHNLFDYLFNILSTEEYEDTVIVQDVLMNLIHLLHHPPNPQNLMMINTKLLYQHILPLLSPSLIQTETFQLTLTLLSLYISHCNNIENNHKLLSIFLPPLFSLISSISNIKDLNTIISILSSIFSYPSNCLYLISFTEDNQFSSSPFSILSSLLYNPSFSDLSAPLLNLFKLFFSNPKIQIYIAESIVWSPNDSLLPVNSSSLSSLLINTFQQKTPSDISLSLLSSLFYSNIEVQTFLATHPLFEPEEDKEPLTLFSLLWSSFSSFLSSIPDISDIPSSFSPLLNLYISTFILWSHKSEIVCHHFLSHSSLSTLLSLSENTSRSQSPVFSLICLLFGEFLLYSEPNECYLLLQHILSVITFPIFHSNLSNSNNIPISLHFIHNEILSRYPLCILNILIVHPSISPLLSSLSLTSNITPSITPTLQEQYQLLLEEHRDLLMLVATLDMEKEDLANQLNSINQQ